LGRCPTGFDKCPVAWSALEEFAIANTERISEIEIVEGPPDLVGYGQQYWETLQSERDEARQAKELEFKQWERENPQIVMSQQHSSAGSSRYNSILSAARLRVMEMGMDAAAAAACAQIIHPDIGGVRLSMCYFDSQNGIYGLVDMCEGFPRFQSVRTDDWLYFRRTTCEWVLSRYYPETKSGKARVPCDGGKLPLLANPWMGTKKPRDPQTVVLHHVEFVAPSDVEEARAQVAAEREQARAAAQAQLDGIAAVVVAGSIDALNGRYEAAPDHDGWPHFVSEQGVHLFRLQSASAWRICPHTDVKPQPSRTLQLISDGIMSVSDGPLAPAKGWSLLQGHRWTSAQIIITLERPPDPQSVEQATLEAIQMGFEEASVRAVQVALSETSTQALVEALLAQ
jgi:hypothetical protein